MTRSLDSSRTALSRPSKSCSARWVTALMPGTSPGVTADRGQDGSGWLDGSKRIMTVTYGRAMTMVGRVAQLISDNN
jgi:hypothetical protein